ncbi:hypothetical protein Mgra_00008642 [Meloidogyne graminicola]|uniref:Uncharacterized protein n=1 Tax=Meloidogyne graminicola TaxID=189291 RepID=A0A8S9ZF76_9BILA|nr:hypothetical protein Mgra_00008642 [Meloidogyne graminicola]
MGIQTLVGCILIVGLNIGIVLATVCPHTRTNTLSSHESNSDSQATRECSAFPILDCYATTTPASTTSASVTSPAASSDSTTVAAPSQVPANATIVNSVTQAAASNSSCPCLLVTELRRIKFLVLTYAQQQIFEVCIQQIEVELLDVTLSFTMKLIKSAFHLKDCFDKNPDIEKACSCQKITGWGRLFEFCQAGHSFGADYMKTAFTGLDSWGNCSLTKAMENATANDACGANTTVIAKPYIEWHKRLCAKLDDDWPIERKFAHISLMFKYYININAPPAVLAAMMNAPIAGFGTVQLFVSYCDMFVSFSSIGNALLGGTADTCPTIQSLNSSINSNATAQQYNSSVISECNNYLSNCYSYLKIESDSGRRLKFFSAQFSFLSSAAHELLYQITIAGTNYQCQFYKLITASHFSTNNNVTFYNNTVPQDYAHCFKPDKNNNTEILTALTYDFRPQLTSIQNSSFNTYYNSIKNCVFNNADYNVAYSCSIPYLKNCFSTVPSVRAILTSTLLWTVIPPPSNNMGTIGGACGCS